jgi:hypothetical protein
VSYLLSRDAHFAQSEYDAIRRDEEHGRYNGFRNTFDEWERMKERAADPLEPVGIEESPEDELEERRRIL